MDYIHTIAETIKLAFADRETFYGDPDFVDVPIEQLLSGDFASKRRALINPKSLSCYASRGPNRRLWIYAFSSVSKFIASFSAPDTSYTCSIDQEGNVCSITPSDVSFESPVILDLGSVRRQGVHSRLQWKVMPPR